MTSYTIPLNAAFLGLAPPKTKYYAHTPEHSVPTYRIKSEQQAPQALSDASEIFKTGIRPVVLYEPIRLRVESTLLKLPINKKNAGRSNLGKYLGIYL